ncbi:alpha/beta fold hydrolase [Mesorhizobium sp. 131-2-1]|uniref:alpha/beta fold hydrolase n=1 Tax=Mesorhizobium sp. 131-2-1 TaxID=2744518 RepID=UPI0019271BC9|nr:alpha/beta hydrolase [Mesorhizobium sp. 131-2-1]
MRSFTLSGDRGNLLYHNIPGVGVPLIFIHGLGCASSCDYPRVACDPALAGRRMVLIDLLGFGFSDRPAGFGYTIDDHARTLVELLSELAPESLDLFGHSMGGSVAIVAASLIGDRVRNLVLSEPNLDPGGGFYSRKVAAMNERDYVAYGHEALVRTSKSDGDGIWAASLSVSAPHAVHRGAISLVAGGKPAWRELLLGMAMPRTVIFGENSLPDEDTQRLPQQGINISVVPQAGHSMAWENPAGLANSLREALS